MLSSIQPTKMTKQHWLAQLNHLMFFVELFWCFVAPFGYGARWTGRQKKPKKNTQEILYIHTWCKEHNSNNIIRLHPVLHGIDFYASPILLVQTYHVHVCN